MEQPLRRHAEDAPQTAAELEALLRAVEVITRDVEQPARLRQYVEVTGRPDAAIGTDLERERVVTQHGRILRPRLEVPVVSEQSETMLTRVTRDVQQAEADGSASLRREDGRGWVATRAAATGVELR